MKVYPMLSSKYIHLISKFEWNFTQCYQVKTYVWSQNLDEILPKVKICGWSQNLENLSKSW